MKVEIKRCFFWADIKVEAVRLKDQIERALNVPVRVRAGAPGALDVYVDGQQIFSKKTAGRMPRADELIDRMRPKT